MARPSFLLGGLMALALLPAAATAQSPERPPGWSSRLALGGEISASLAPTDDDAFFNYTDYDHDALRAVRLRVFAEWRLAGPLSLVAEGRIDNATGLEPAAWYVRWRPRPGWNVDLQAGRIPPVIGGFGRRAYGRDNPLFGAPLAYQYLTSLRPDALPADADDVLRMRGRGWRPSFPLGSNSVAPGVPLLSSSRWDTGVQARWSRGPLELAGAVTRGAPAAPVVEETNGGLQWSGRIATFLRGGLIIGLSGSTADWLDDDAVRTLPSSLRDHRSQRVVGVDVEWGRGAWLVRAEWLHSTFALPIRDAPDPRARLRATGGFIEARFRPRVRWQVAARVGRLGFSELTGPERGTQAWDAPVSRVETVVSYRLTRHLDLRGGWQHNWRDGGRIRSRGFPMIGGLLWF